MPQGKEINLTLSTPQMPCFNNVFCFPATKTNRCDLSTQGSRSHNENSIDNGITGVTP
jgi:hypothetical protein